MYVFLRTSFLLRRSLPPHHRGAVIGLDISDPAAATLRD